MNDQTNATPTGTPRADRQTRELALSHAVSVAAQQQTGNYSGQTIVNIAKRFENYLNGASGTEGEQ